MTKQVSGENYAISYKKKNRRDFISFLLFPPNLKLDFKIILKTYKWQKIDYTIY